MWAERALSWALRSGLRKGVAGGNGLWFVVAVAAGVVKFMRRPSKTNALTLNLAPGERYSIACSDEPIAR